ncbi:hypothetical protein BCR43DRAFT_498156 [Syncephalastrum racemosum]|uniref:GATA-type domain-containing protein n=1 Tax=Syncephalastrum racemosum TaxID=13706 RepID=A0A1X2H3D6_SYNRA|nr:hypothetical protein BCR43DRAFT_498156 [Syncephalastrum racemosum]
MTVKSPFYNKPSTATSVDSCHKCPLDVAPKTQDSNAVPMPTTSELQAQPSRAGFEQAQVSTSSPSSNTSSSVAEPCSSSAAKSDIGSTPVTSCSNCGTTSTPLWRRSPQGETICNACGLYLKARNTTRPPWLKRNSTKRPTPAQPVALAPAPPISPVTTNHHRLALTPAAATPSTSTATASHDDPNARNDSMLTCANCNTATTPLWRRDDQGNTICNACGLYYKLHNVHRPMTMKRSIIKRRKRVTVASIAAAQHQAAAAGAFSSSDESDEGIRIAPKRKLASEDMRPKKRIELPTLAAKTVATTTMRPLLPLQPRSPRPVSPPTMASASIKAAAPQRSLDPVEPDAFHKFHHLPSPPMKPTSNIAHLLNPPAKPENSLPSISLPSLPSPPLTAHEMHPAKDETKQQPQQQHPSPVATAAALATVSALLNPTVNPQQTHQMLEAHRSELQREVTNLTSLLSRTTAMLQNLDQVMAVTNTNSAEQQGVAHALVSLFALAASSSAKDKEQPAKPHDMAPAAARRSLDARV